MGQKGHILEINHLLNEEILFSRKEITQLCFIFLNEMAISVRKWPVPRQRNT